MSAPRKRPKGKKAKTPTSKSKKPRPTKATRPEQPGQSDPRPDVVLPPDQPAHAIRSVFGSAEPTDGSPIDREEERRALSKIRFDSERAARKANVPAVGDLRADESHPQTDLSDQLRGLAEKPMNDAAVQWVRVKGERTFERPDGTKEITKVSASNFAFRPGVLFAELRTLLREVKKVFGKLRGRFGFSIKAGPLHMGAKAEIEQEAAPTEIVVPQSGAAAPDETPKAE